MARKRKKRLLNPAARQGMDMLKKNVMGKALGKHIASPNDVSMEVAKQLGIPFEERGNGELKAEDAGKIGGVIGGSMVKELVRMAEASLAHNRK